MQRRYPNNCHQRNILLSGAVAATMFGYESK